MTITLQAPTAVRKPRGPAGRSMSPAVSVSACGLAGGAVGWAGGWVVGFVFGSVALMRRSSASSAGGGRT